MHNTLGWLALAVLAPSLACGAQADSSQRRPPEQLGATCSSDADCSSGACRQQVCASGDTSADVDDPSRAAESSLPSDREAARSSGPFCPDGVFSQSIEVRDQATLDQLKGCERLSGFLTLYLFSGIDETPLQSLRDVDGGIAVYGSAEPVANPIDGFRALEESTSLQLQDLTLSDLQPLGRLKHIGPETSPLYSVPISVVDGGSSGALRLFACSGLTSLRGLGALESVQGIVLRDDPDLVSLAGLERLRSLPVLRAENSPLLDLGGIGERGLERLEISSSALTGLSGLGNASALTTLRLQGNDSLRSLEGGQMPAQLESVLLSDNPALIDLKGLEALNAARSIEINSSTGSALETLSGLDGLRQVVELRVMAQTRLRSISALRELESAGELSFLEVPSLQSLEGLSKLQSVDSLSLAAPALASFSGLGSARIGELFLSGIPRLDLTGLERSSIVTGLTLSGIEQLSAPGGLPQIDASFPASLSIEDSPLLGDLQALAPLTGLGSLTLRVTGVENLDALAQLTRLTNLYLLDNSALQQIDTLAGVAGLETLVVRNNPALSRLPVFSNTACDTCADFGLELVDNAALQVGPGLPRVGHAREVLVTGNPALTSLAGIGALRFVGSIQIERNPSLVDLALPQLEQAEVLVVRGNRTLDDTQLVPLRQLRDSQVKIVSNLSGPAQLAPCPWISDGVCDEQAGDCAAGSDSEDCGHLL
jgi:Leucine-rich repeat (LRR) protein